MADLIPTIVLAIGATTAGAPEALRFLLSFAGHSPAVDISICVFAIATATTAVLGVMLLARYLRVRGGVARDAAAPPAPADAEEVFLRMVRMVAFPVAFLVAACLLVAQARGELDAGRYVRSA